MDCVGVTEGPLPDTEPLERQKNVAMRAILEHVAMGGTNPHALSSLASRLESKEAQGGTDEVQTIRREGDQTLSGDRVRGMFA